MNSELPNLNIIRPNYLQKLTKKDYEKITVKQKTVKVSPNTAQALTELATTERDKLLGISGLKVNIIGQDS